MDTEPPRDYLPRKSGYPLCCTDCFCVCTQRLLVFKSGAHFVPACCYAGFEKRISQVLDLWPTRPQNRNVHPARGSFSEVLKKACCWGRVLEGGQTTHQSADELYQSYGQATRSAAASAYSSRRSKRQKTGVRSLKELLDWNPAASNGDAASWLLKAGVVKRPRSCTACGGRTVQGPLELSRKGRKPHWHWRCASWKCQKRRSFLEDSTFSGLQARIPT